MHRKHIEDGDGLEAEGFSEYSVSGSWESLMQGYGEEEWTKFKMIPIKHFVEDFDPNYISWEEFEQQNLDSIYEEKLEALKKKQKEFNDLKA